MDGSGAPGPSSEVQLENLRARLRVDPAGWPSAEALGDRLGEAELRRLADEVIGPDITDPVERRTLRAQLFHVLVARREREVRGPGSA